MTISGKSNYTGSASHKITIKHCTGCIACVKALMSGRGNLCIHKDDFDWLAWKMFTADGIIMVDPIFETGASGLFHTIMDRFGPRMDTGNNFIGMQIAKGIGSLFTHTQNVSWPNSSDANGWYRSLSNMDISTGSGKFTLPMGLIILVIIAIICAIVLNKTRPGRYMICLGANREAVRLSGVDTRRWEMLAYIICGALAGFAAIFFVGCYTTVQPGRGDTFNNEAIAACVMGGTSMAGGLASILGTVIGAFIIAIMQEGILSMGLNISYQYALTGLIVLGAVIADTLSRRRKN